MGVGVRQEFRMLQQLLLLTFLALAQAESECLFVSGVACPVEVMNALDVFYYDINDETSCQHQCNTIGACNFFTQLPAGDNSHMKCFLFSTCDNEEACDSCLSGPEEPPMGECLRTASNPGWNKTKRSAADGYTCPTTVDNVVDIFYRERERRERQRRGEERERTRERENERMNDRKKER